jgi:hypothetical protein
MRSLLVVIAVALAGASWTSSALAVPQITNIQPESGGTAGGTIITISGTGFGAAGNFVMVGQDPCLSPMLVPGGITCTLPPGSGANRPVRVIDDAGMPSAPYPFSYSPPQVTAVTAASAPTAGGTVITITGQNFGADGVSRRVTINGSGDCSSPSTALAHTSITCTLPPGAGSNLPVGVEVDGQTSSVDGSLSYDPPAITAVTPTHGPATGSIPLTIVGSNFSATASVAVGGALCPVDVQTDGRIECDLPPATPGAPSSDVRVVAGGQASPPAPFSYQALASKCDAAKIKAATTYAKCLGTAKATGAKKGVAVAAATLTKCDDKMTAACTKAESSGDCSQTGTCDALALKIRHKGWDGLIY